MSNSLKPYIIISIVAGVTLRLVRFFVIKGVIDFTINDYKKRENHIVSQTISLKNTNDNKYFLSEIKTSYLENDFDNINIELDIEFKKENNKTNRLLTAKQGTIDLYFAFYNGASEFDIKLDSKVEFAISCSNQESVIYEELFSYPISNINVFPYFGSFGNETNKNATEYLFENNMNYGMNYYSWQNQIVSSFLFNLNINDYLENLDENALSLKESKHIIHSQFSVSLKPDCEEDIENIKEDFIKKNIINNSFICVLKH